MNAYTPRRCSKRWLNDDCPAEILAIMDHRDYPSERYTVIYTDVDNDGHDNWLTYIAVGEAGQYYHGEMKAHEVAQYRYRQKHRYARWSDLPEAVKNVVRRDLKAAEK